MLIFFIYCWYRDSSYSSVYTGNGVDCGYYCMVKRFEQSPCISSYVPYSPPWLKYGGFIIVVIIMMICFWGLALVCDHYFCSALMILCEDKGIPENVAGATIMAIGTSAADLMIR